jgi:hypothetical protein
MTTGPLVSTGRSVTDGRPVFPRRPKPTTIPVAVAHDIRTSTRGGVVAARARAAIAGRVTGSYRVLPVVRRPAPWPVPVLRDGLAAIPVPWLAAWVPLTRHIAGAASSHRLIGPRQAARIVAATRHWPGCPRFHRLGRVVLPYLLMGRLMPDLPLRLRLVPDLARRIRPDRLRLDGPALDRLRLNRPALDRPTICGGTMRRLASGWLGPVLTRRDDRRDRPSDPERVKPLLGLDVASLDRDFAPRLARLGVLPITWRAVLSRLTLFRLAPTPAPPGHG